MRIIFRIMIYYYTADTFILSLKFIIILVDKFYLNLKNDLLIQRLILILILELLTRLVFQLIYLNIKK